EKRVVPAGEDESEDADDSLLAVARGDEIVALVRLIPVLPVHQRRAVPQHVAGAPVVADEAHQLRSIIERAQGHIDGHGWPCQIAAAIGAAGMRLPSSAMKGGFG